MISFDDGAQVQLLAPLSAESTIAKFLDRNGPGLQQLAYRVDDVRVAAEQARSAGIRTLVRRAAPRHRRVVDQFPAPEGRRRGAGRVGPARPSARHNRRCVRGVGTGEWDDDRMSSNEWLPAQIPFDLVRRGFAPDQVTAHLERLEYDLRIATANGDATNQRLSEVSAQLHNAQAEADDLRAQLDNLAREPVSMTGLSNRMQRMIRLAEEEAAEIRARANAEADKVTGAAAAAAAATAAERETFDGERERTRRQLADQVRDMLAEANHEAETLRRNAAAGVAGHARRRHRRVRAAADRRRGGIQGDADRRPSGGDRHADRGPRRGDGDPDVRPRGGRAHADLRPGGGGVPDRRIDGGAAAAGRRGQRPPQGDRRGLRDRDQLPAGRGAPAAHRAGGDLGRRRQQPDHRGHRRGRTARPGGHRPRRRADPAGGGRIPPAGRRRRPGRAGAHRAAHPGAGSTRLAARPPGQGRQAGRVRARRCSTRRTPRPNRPVTADFPVDPAQRPTDLPASYNTRTRPVGRRHRRIGARGARDTDQRGREQGGSNGRNTNARTDDDDLEALTADLSFDKADVPSVSARSSTSHRRWPSPTPIPSPGSPTATTRATCPRRRRPTPSPLTTPVSPVRSSTARGCAPSPIGPWAAGSATVGR